MIQINKQPGQKVLELGGGDNPNPVSDCNVDMRQGAKTNFTADFNAPLPIASEEWDCVFSQFALEHISYRNIPAFLLEVFRITKPGGRAIFVTANTEAQLKWIQDHPEGWDGRDFFDSASGKLFGDNDYPENTHRAFFSPTIVIDLFQKAGFEDIQVQPYGERSTDLFVEAKKPEMAKEEVAPNQLIVVPSAIQEQETPQKELSLEERRKLFNYIARKDFSIDWPVHEITFQHLMARKPESVLELGCGKGFILKRLQDVGIDCWGLDISSHCYKCRVSDRVVTDDVEHWVSGTMIPRDLCFSMDFWHCIPVSLIPGMMESIGRICKRGLHGINFNPQEEWATKRPREWWMSMMPKGHEVFSKQELEKGNLPIRYVNGDGKVKINFGSYMTMFPHGWINTDIIDLKPWADQHKYQFRQLDVRQGLPWNTGEVDLIMCMHMLEHLTYKEGRSFLRECRRVLKPKGVMRIVVPDASMLIRGYLNMYTDDDVGLSNLDDVNEQCRESAKDIEKLWAVLFAGHLAAYDAVLLSHTLQGCGFTPALSEFRGCVSDQIKKETLDLLPCLSLYMDGT